MMTFEPQALNLAGRLPISFLLLAIGLALGAVGGRHFHDKRLLSCAEIVAGALAVTGGWWLWWMP